MDKNIFDILKVVIENNDEVLVVVMYHGGTSDPAHAR